MFEEEVKNLTPYDKYVILINDLNETYLFANGTYELGQFEVEFKNTKHADKYLTNITNYRNKLKRDYDLTMQVKTTVNEQDLDGIEKKLFFSDNELFNKIQALLAKMDDFLAQHNIELSL